MRDAVVINGRITGPKNVELDEPVMDMTGEVEVILRQRGDPSVPGETVAQLLRRLPPGTRSREEINQQMQDERAAWEGRE